MITENKVSEERSQRDMELIERLTRERAVKAEREDTVQAEPHCHTKEVSICGHIPAVEIAHGYHEKGYGILVITDHYYKSYWERGDMADLLWEDKLERYFEGYRLARQEGEKLGLTVLYALELQFDGFEPYDFLILGPEKEYLLKNPYLNRSTPADFHKEAQRQGFLMYQAHPYRYGKSPLLPITYDGIEIYNAHPRHNSHNQNAVHFAAEHGLKIIAGSDCHRPPDLGRGGILLPKSVKTMSAMVDYLKKETPEMVVTYEPLRENVRFEDD